MDSGKKQNFHEHNPPLLDAWPAWWRAKIGIISPSVDLASFREQQTIFPEGVLLLQTRALMGPDNTPEAFVKQTDDVIHCIKVLATTEPDVISYSCTAPVALKGAEFERNLIRQIEEISGAKGASMALSVVKALEALNARKIVLVAPYLQEIVDAEDRYLESYGVKVLYSETLAMKGSMKVPARPPWENFSFALNAYRKAPEAEAIFFSGGAMRTLEIIEHLEKATGKPVISSSLCNAWMCLKLAGIREPIYGYGSLLAKER